MSAFLATTLPATTAPATTARVEAFSAQAFDTLWQALAVSGWGLLGIFIFVCLFIGLIVLMTRLLAPPPAPVDPDAIDPRQAGN